MLVVYSFCPKDEKLALKNAEWIISLKNSDPHAFLVTHDSRCNPFPITSILSRKFQCHEPLPVKDHWNRCPGSPEAMFAQSARHLEYLYPTTVKYFLWLEVDAIPVQDYWLDKIEEEYLRANQKFMGALVGRWNDCPEHLSGIAVYPNPLIKYAGMMLLAEGENIQFDVVDADNVRNQSHFTDLIQNRTSGRVKEGEVWKVLDEPPPFKDKDDFYSVATKECVLFHSDKYGRIPEIFGGSGHGSGTAEKPPSKALPDFSTDTDNTLQVTKRCNRCEGVFPIYKFRCKKNPKCKKPVIDSYCITCRRTSDKEIRKKVGRKSYKRQIGEKQFARDELYKSIQRGEIVKPDKCSRCGNRTDSKELHAHHLDYKKPFSVIWICRTCHNKEHPYQSYSDVLKQIGSDGSEPKPTPSKTNKKQYQKKEEQFYKRAMRAPEEGDVCGLAVFRDGAWRSALADIGLQDHVQWLKDYAEKDGFSRMRVYKALIAAGLREKKKK